MQKITPNLWFSHEAEEAATFYTSIFKNSRIISSTHYTEAGQDVHGMDPGTVMTIDFELEGYKFVGLNGGPVFTFTPSVSFFVNCSTKDEVAELWAKLSDGGMILVPLQTYPFSESYGWTKDKFGVSWQINFSAQATQKIIPSLMFVGDKCGKAEEAINFYTGVFKNAKIGDIARYGEGQAPDTPGTVSYGAFTLEGQSFAAMDSAEPHNFTFTEATSFIIDCADQTEVDYYWEKLSAEPASEQCGWLKDKYGVSWQVVPSAMNKLISGTDEKSKRAMQAMLQMKKLDIKKLQEAYDGK